MNSKNWTIQEIIFHTILIIFIGSRILNGNWKSKNRGIVKSKIKLESLKLEHSNFSWLIGFQLQLVLNLNIHFTLRQHLLVKAFSIQKVGYPRPRLADGVSIQTDPDIGHNHVSNPVSSKGRKLKFIFLHEAFKPFSDFENGYNFVKALKNGDEDAHEML